MSISSFNNIIESAINESVHNIQVPASLDYKIITAAKNSFDSRDYKNNFSFFRYVKIVGASVFFVFFVFMGILKIEEEMLKRKCIATYEEMIRAVEEKDIEKSLSFYSFKDLNISEDKIKRNIEEFYNSYDNIKYNIKNLNITIKGKNILGKSKYELYAYGKKNTINYIGEDRIYFKRVGNKLKIYAWIAENSKENKNF